MGVIAIIRVESDNSLNKLWYLLLLVFLFPFAMPTYKKKSGKKRKYGSKYGSSKRNSVPGLTLDPMSALALANMRTGGNMMRFNHPSNVEAKSLDINVFRDTHVDVNLNGGVPNAIDCDLVNFDRDARLFVGPGIVAGTGAAERIGRQIYLKHLQYRFLVKNSLTIGDTVYRLVCFLDRQNNRDNNAEPWGTGAGTGAVARYQECFDDPAATATGVTFRTIATFRNLANSARYKVLLDKYVRVAAMGLNLGANTNQSSIVQGIIPVREKFEYFGNTAAISELTSNCLHFYMIPWCGENIGDRVQIYGVVRLRWLDA